MKKIELYVTGDTDQTIVSLLYDVADILNRGIKSAKITGLDYKIDFNAYELIELPTDDVLDV
jgi:hypothetical protein